MRLFGTIVALALGLVAAPAAAATVPVAVAANFTAVAEELARGFQAKTGDTVQLSFGSSGQLYTQISQGAPFEVFLSADTARTDKAVAEGLGVAGSNFTYAVGRIALYSASLDVSDGEAVLRGGNFDKLAIADPTLAPYGAAAMETLDKLGLTAAITPKLVTAQNISQALQFIDSGNAELGFVALSQVIDSGNSKWLVPPELYAPIEQGAVLLKTGENDAAARAFLTYLRSDEAVAVIEKAGYAVR